MSGEIQHSESLQTHVPKTISDAVEHAATYEVSSTSAYVRKAIVNQLRLDGYIPSDEAPTPQVGKGSSVKGAVDTFPDGNLAWSIQKFADMTDLGRSTIYEAIKDGLLVARKNGKRTVITAADGMAWLKSLPLIPTAARRRGSDG